MKNFAFIFIILLFASCEKSNDVQFTDTPIIESYLLPGNCLTLTVSHQIPFSSDAEYSGEDINNLSITVKYNDSISHILTPLGEGKYIDSSFVLSEGDYIEMGFEYNSNNIWAYTYLPVKPSGLTISESSISIARRDSASGPPSSGSMPDPISLTWNNTDDSYYLVVVECMESTLDPIQDFGTGDAPQSRFRKSPGKFSSEDIRAMDFNYFGSHRIILYHVLPDYADLYNQTNNSSLNLTNPSTSIKYGYGIFTGLNSDTVYIEVLESSKKSKM